MLCKSTRFACKLRILILCIFTSLLVNAQDLPRLSLLTCSPGDELYSSYGHTAIRLVDEKRKWDIVFNYGTFNFATPNFYGKFLNGTLDYCLSVSQTSNFIHEYKRENRRVVEREFILSSSQRQDLAALLLDNAKEQNRYYRYDFFKDNCATRVRDIVTKVANRPIVCGTTSHEATYRDYIHNYVSTNQWAGQGIDLILGKPTDNYVDYNAKAMLPDSLEAWFIENKLVGEAQILCEQSHSTLKKSLFAYLSPLTLSCAIFILIVAITIIEYRKHKYYKVVDVCLLTILSILSLIFTYLWFISEISCTSYNYNVLWASILCIPILINIACNRRNTICKWLIFTNIALIAVWIIISLLGVQFAPYIGISLALSSVVRYARILQTF